MVTRYDQLDPSTLAAVQRFLAARGPAVSLEHDPRWLSVLRQSLGHRTFALLTRTEQGEVTGYLPLACVATRLFGRFLVSLPYVNRAGIVADAATAPALLDAAVEQAQLMDADYLELRHDAPLTHPQLGAARADKVRMVLELPRDPEALWKGYDAKVRNQVRKGEKHNLCVRFGGAELLTDFYSVFAVNMRDLGTPVYPRRLFEQVLIHFHDQAELAVVSMDGFAVAGALLMHGTNSSIVPSASCLRSFNETNANMWMYDQLLRRAVERRSASFDFGRSSEDSGTYRFKRQWGAQPVPTLWQYHVRRGSIDAVRPDDPRYRRKIEVWKKLPVWVTKLAGPRIVRGIP